MSEWQLGATDAYVGAKFGTSANHRDWDSFQWEDYRAGYDRVVRKRWKVRLSTPTTRRG